MLDYHAGELLSKGYAPDEVREELKFTGGVPDYWSDVYKKYKDNKVFVQIHRKTYWDWCDNFNSKSDEDKLLLLMFLACKSIAGSKNKVQTNWAMIAARMAGEDVPSYKHHTNGKHKGEKVQCLPEHIKKHLNPPPESRRKWERLREDLSRFGVKYYAPQGSRGFWISTKKVISLEELIYSVESDRPMTAAQMHREKVKQAREKAARRIAEEQGLQTVPVEVVDPSTVEVVNPQTIEPPVSLPGTALDMNVILGVSSSTIAHIDPQPMGYKNESFEREHKWLLEVAQYTKEVEQYCKTHKITYDDYINFLNEIENDWVLTEKTHKDKVDFKKHLISTMNIKISKQKMTYQYQRQAEMNQLASEYAATIARRLAEDDARMAGQPNQDEPIF